MEDQIIFKITTNDLILEKIFSFLDTNSLKNCRLMNSLWEKLANPFLHAKTRLNLGEMLTCCSKLEQIPKINPIFVKDIKVDFSICKGKCFNESIQSGSARNDIILHNFSLFCLSYKTTIESITYHQSKLDIVSFFCNVLLSFNFPVLKRLEIVVSKIPHFWNYAMRTIFVQNVIPNLKEIVIRVDKHVAEALRANVLYIAKPKWIQDILDFSPALERFEIQLPNLNIDLKGNQKLKTLAYRHYQGCPNSPNDMISTLSSATESLESLILQQIYNPLYRSQNETVVLPEMKRLKSLKIIAAASAHFKFFEILPVNPDTECLPNLKSLEIPFGTLMVKDYQDSLRRKLVPNSVENKLSTFASQINGEVLRALSAMRNMNGR